MPKTRAVFIHPPPTLVSLGVVDYGEPWVVERALDGLKETPTYWEEKRDTTLNKVDVKHKGKTYTLNRSTVHHSIWHMYDQSGVPVHKDPVSTAQSPTPVLPVLRGAPVATVGVYVDDFLYCGPFNLLEPLHQELCKSFEGGTLNILGKGGCNSLTFVGITMELDPTNAKKLTLRQASYAHGLLGRFTEDVEGGNTVATYTHYP